MTEYVGRYYPKVGIWLEVIPEWTIQEVLFYIAIVILLTAVYRNQIIATIKKVTQ